MRFSMDRCCLDSLRLMGKEPDAGKKKKEMEWKQIDRRLYDAQSYRIKHLPQATEN